MSTATVDPWTMTRPEPKAEGSGYKYELIPADNFPGAPVALFYIGQHWMDRKDKKTGEQKRVLEKKLVIVYEIAETRSDGKPHLLAEKVTWSLNENATFFGRAGALLGREVVVNETIDPRELLARPCMVDVGHTAPKKNAKGEERVYHQLKGIAKLARGVTPHVPITPTVAWSVSDGDPVPPGDWPFIFGQSIAEIAAESVEAGERKTAEIKARAAAMGASVTSFDECGPAPFE